MPGPVAPRRLGVLGGMGPEATVLLMSRVIARTPAADDADHVPMLVDQNPQVPSRIRALIDGDGPSPAPVLAAMAAGLARAGAEALAMACNSAHAYAAEIRAASGLPFLDMVELTAAAAATGRRRVGVLASPAVERTGLYARALAARGAEALHGEDRDGLLAAIRTIKAGGDPGPAVAILSRQTEALVAGGAEAVVVACTEFSLVADRIVCAVPVIDALDLLADAMIAFAMTRDAGG